MAISLKRYERQVAPSAETGQKAITGGLASTLIEAAGSEDKIIANTIDAVSGLAGEYIKEKNELEVAGRQVALEDYIDQWETDVSAGVNEALLANNNLTYEDAYTNEVQTRIGDLNNWVTENMQRAGKKEKLVIDSTVNKAVNGVNGTLATQMAAFTSQKAALNLSNRYQSLDQNIYNLQEQINLAPKDTPEEQEAVKIIQENLGALVEQQQFVSNKLGRTLGPQALNDLQVKTRRVRYSNEIDYLVDQFNLGKIGSAQKLEEQSRPLREEIENDNVLNDLEKTSITFALSEEIRDVQIKEVKDTNTFIKSLVASEKPSAPQALINGTAKEYESIVQASKLKLEKGGKQKINDATLVIEELNNFTENYDFKSFIQTLGNKVSDDYFNIGLVLATDILNELAVNNPNAAILSYKEGGAFDLGLGPGSKKITIKASDSAVLTQVRSMARQVNYLSPQKTEDAEVKINEFLTKGYRALINALKEDGVTNEDGSVNADLLNEKMSSFYSEGDYNIALELYRD